ncbi:hypothetical protein ACJQWK_02670 [Exserohilum turcicum]
MRIVDGPGAVELEGTEDVSVAGIPVVCETPEDSEVRDVLGMLDGVSLLLALG